MNTWTKQEIATLEKWYGKVPARDIPALDRSERSIYIKANRIGLQVGAGRYAQYSYNHEFFQHVSNPVTCYWAGFIAADGCVHDKHGWRLAVDLAVKDIGHLHKFKRAIQFDGPIWSNERHCVINLHDAKNIAHDLAANFNIVPRKSLILKYPTLHDKDCTRAFIRGYMDGDGWITLNKHVYPVVGFCGTKSTLEGICQALEFLDIHWPKFQQKANIHSISFQADARKILDWLYTDSTPATRLDRKHTKYQELS